MKYGIGTISNLNEKVVEAKDEMILVIKNENRCLKTPSLATKKLKSMTKRPSKSTLRIGAKKQELESINRKYKLM